MKASENEKGPNTQESLASLLNNSSLNRDTAFSEKERKQFNLEGLLPVVVETIDQQLKRVNLHLENKPSDIERYIYLTSLRDRNETLFFKALMSDPARFIPIMYDPTVAEACLKYSHIYREKSGMYISPNEKGRVREVLENWPVKDVRFICVSTGGRILGLGDLGADGMGIPLGKLQLYTACAAVPPNSLLPLLLDCGTDNQTLLDDPLYIGLRKKRPSTEDLDIFVDEFVNAVQSVFPDCCIHFEDWKGTDAIRLLTKYKNNVCCYNDDIQGTAAVALAGIMGALDIKGEKLKDQKVLFLGAGSAGLGIANMIAVAMQQDGLTEAEARANISLFDVNGLLAENRTDLSPEQQIYISPVNPTHDLLTAINEIKPSILIGVSTIGKAFTEEIVKAMATINKRPVIFALSNPTDHAECSAEEAYKWTNGSAIYASGVPFDSVQLNGKTFVPGQANNFYCFPGVSLAIYATNPKLVTDGFWIESANALAGLLTDDERKKGMVFPPQSNILNISTQVAIKVAAAIFKAGLARVEQPDDIAKWIADMQYQPVYPELL
jgi:malate dehydrogenase (oxaloacetate-decarboxylating)(NADP+)